MTFDPDNEEDEEEGKHDPAARDADDYMETGEEVPSGGDIHSKSAITGFNFLSIAPEFFLML